MSDVGASILHSLGVVQEQRHLRASVPGLGEAVLAIKRYQHARFAMTYADLRQELRYAGAVDFFLNDLYGPGDFSSRDEQFARVVPALVRLFPSEIVSTVAVLGDLHALSERLDTRMGEAHGKGPLTDASYQLAWQSVSFPEERARQVQWMVDVGSALDRFTRRPLLRQSLRLMRVPAQAAGLGALQAFLERGFDTFRGIQGAAWFLACIADRESTIAAQLFGPEPFSAKSWVS